MLWNVTCNVSPSKSKSALMETCESSGGDCENVLR
jgi:hypothetical protein